MKAMILAAGRGERMRPLTDSCPKPLLRAGGKPLIEWQIDKLAQAGFDQIVINHAYLGQQLVEAYQDGRALGVNLQWSAEGAAGLETAGGIAQALPWLGDTPFVVVNGDVFCDFPLASLRSHCARLSPEQSWAHLVLVPNPDHHPEGDFGLDSSGQLCSSTPRYTFSGIGVYHPCLFAGLERGQSAKLAPLLRHAIADQRIRGEVFTGRWVDVGTPQRLAWLDQQLTANLGANPA